MAFICEDGAKGRVFGLRCISSAVLVVTLAGCSLWNSGSSKPMPADLGANVAVLGVRQAWTARIGSVAGLPLGVHSAGNVVTVSSSDGVVAAIGARTGGDGWGGAPSEPFPAGGGSDGKS